MKSSTSFLLSALTSALLASFSASTFALNLADEDKLKDLERAMGGSSGTMAEGEAPAEDEAPAEEAEGEEGGEEFTL